MNFINKKIVRYFYLVSIGLLGHLAILHAQEVKIAQITEMNGYTGAGFFENASAEGKELCNVAQPGYVYDGFSVTAGYPNDSVTDLVSYCRHNISSTDYVLWVYVFWFQPWGGPPTDPNCALISCPSPPVPPDPVQVAEPLPAPYATE